jgi:GH25 family lysozyme M1 (1,4-beta-N-acetylmuramidase)
LRENGKLLPPDKQKHIDFNKMKAEGISATILKAGQDTYKDPAFDVGWQNAKLAGIPRGSYWFLDKDNSPYFQARLYWDIMKNDPGEGFLSGDIEFGSPTDWNSWYIFFNELQQISGLPDHKIFLYSNYYFWLEHCPKIKSQREWFSNRFPLWLAGYTDPKYVNTVKVPPEWTKATLWQYGTPVLGIKLGVWSKEIDMNLLNGGLIELKKYFDLSGEIHDEPNPIKTFPYEITFFGKKYKGGI